MGQMNPDVYVWILIVPDGSSWMDPIGSDGFWWVKTDPDGSKLALMGPDVSWCYGWILVRPNGSWWVLMDPDGPWLVLMGPDGFYQVVLLLMGPEQFLWFLMGPEWSLQGLVGIIDIIGIGSWRIMMDTVGSWWVFSGHNCNYGSRWVPEDPDWSCLVAMDYNRFLWVWRYIDGSLWVFTLIIILGSWILLGLGRSCQVLTGILGPDDLIRQD